MEGSMAEIKEEVRKGVELGIRFNKTFPNVFTNCGVDLNLAARALGDYFNKKIFVKNADLSKMKGGISGFTFVREDGVYIVVNSDEPPYRQRFTIAHELGHIFNGDIDLGKIDNLNMVCRSDLELFYGDPEKFKLEQMANSFAAEILMPEDQVLSFMKSGVSVEEMAMFFGVSPQAMRIRIAGILHSQDHKQPEN